MIVRIIEKILCWIYPYYFEVNFCYADVSKNRIEHFLSFDDAMGRIRECVGNKELTLWTLDKYVNIRPHFLVKISRWHKGRYVNQNYIEMEIL